jgi:hypothetical protein
MFNISLDKKKKGVKCCAYACNNLPVKKLGGLCHKHYRRKRREIDPVYCRFNNFKGNAKRRNKPFNITLEEFRNFCKDTGYLITKGKRGQNATIDRIDNRKGYSIDNIQLLSNRMNARKGDTIDEETLEDIINHSEGSNEDLPF